MKVMSIGRRERQMSESITMKDCAGVGTLCIPAGLCIYLSYGSKEMGR